MSRTTGPGGVRRDKIMDKRRIFLTIFLMGLIVWPAAAAADLSQHLSRPLSFGGEPVPLNQNEVYQSVDQNLLLLSEAKSRVWLTMRRAGRFLPAVEAELKKAGVHTDMVYIPMAVTSLAPDYNSSGRGMWRLKEAEAKTLGLKMDANVDERLDPIASTQAAAKRLKELRTLFGNWTTAMAAYLVGDKLVSQAVAEAGGEKNYYKIYLPDGQDQIPASVLAAKILYQDPASFGYRQSTDRAWSPLNPKRVTLTQGSTARALADQYKQDYKTFRDINPHLLTGLVPAGTTINVP